MYGKSFPATEAAGNRLRSAVHPGSHPVCRPALHIPAVYFRKSREYPNSKYHYRKQLLLRLLPVRCHSHQTDSFPAAQAVADLMLGSFSATPLEGYLFNAAAGMKLVGEKELVVRGANNIKM